MTENVFIPIAHFEQFYAPKTEAKLPRAKISWTKGISKIFSFLF